VKKDLDFSEAVTLYFFTLLCVLVFAHLFYKFVESPCLRFSQKFAFKKKPQSAPSSINVGVMPTRN